jgi:hypothetical protein
MQETNNTSVIFDRSPYASSKSACIQKPTNMLNSYFVFDASPVSLQRLSATRHQRARNVFRTLRGNIHDVPRTIAMMIVASLATQHRRLLNIVGYSTSSTTQHRRLLNIVNYSTSSVTQHRQLLNIVGYSTSSVTQHRQPQSK